MIYQKAPNEELIQSVNDDRARLKKEAEEALDANRANAEEIEKFHGVETNRQVVTSNGLKAMHLSESLFDTDDWNYFRGDLYREISYICDQHDDVTKEDVQRVFDEFLDNYQFAEEEDFEDIPGFEDTMDGLDNLSLFGESMRKKRLGESVGRYSDNVPYDKRKYWYFTLHGVQPGSIPKDLNVLKVQYGQNDKGTWGTFVCLDGILNTSELKAYDMRELAPQDDSLDEEFDMYEGF